MPNIVIGGKMVGSSSTSSSSITYYSGLDKKIYIAKLYNSRLTTTIPNSQHMPDSII